MIVILDTNIFCRDFYMRGTQAQLLQQMHNIIVPEIVYDETLNKHREKIRECGRQIENKVDEYNRIASIPLSLNVSEAYEEEDKRYEDFMMEFLLKNGDCAPTSYPNVSHKDVVSRALQRKKPFKADGRDGYRDYLVWRSVLEEVSHSAEIVHFVSENPKDFADENDKNKLHPDLLEEMRDLGIDDGKLMYWSSLKSFIDEVVKPELERAEEEKQLISEYLNNAEFLESLHGFLKEQLTGLNIWGYEVFVPGGNPEIESVEEGNIVIFEIAKTDDKKYLLSMAADCWIEIRSTLSKQEFSKLTEDDLEDSSVEADGNMMIIHSCVPLDVQLEIISASVGGGIITAEITDISDGRYCGYCPYE